MEHPSRFNYHNNPVNEREYGEFDPEDSDEDNDDGPSKIEPEACFGGKSPPIDDHGPFMRLRETKK